MAVGYVKLEEGPGKLLFDQPEVKVAGGEQPGTGGPAIDEDKLEEARKAAVEIEERISNTKLCLDLDALKEMSLDKYRLYCATAMRPRKEMRLTLTQPLTGNWKMPEKRADAFQVSDTKNSILMLL